MSTMTLKDLEGLPGLTEAQYARSRAAAVRAVRNGSAATSAGSRGAINIWRDERGRLHAAFYRHYSMRSHEDRLTLTGLTAWLREWWPKLERE